jgi:hypothetical protein
VVKAVERHGERAIVSVEKVATRSGGTWRQTKCTSASRQLTLRSSPTLKALHQRIGLAHTISWVEEDSLQTMFFNQASDACALVGDHWRKQLIGKLSDAVAQAMRFEERARHGGPCRY